MVDRISIDCGATVYRQGACWYLDLCRQGHRSRKALKTSNRDQALALARQLVAERASHAWGIQIPREVEYASFLAQYKAYSELHHAENTRKLNWPILVRFAAFVTARHGLTKRPLRLSDATREDVEAFQASEAARGVRNKTVNVYIGAVAAFFSHAVERGACRINPASKVEPLEYQGARHRALSSGEIQKLLAKAMECVPFQRPECRERHAGHERITPLLDVCLLILNTGLRLGEAIHLEWSDVDFEDKMMYVRFKEDYKPKDRDERSLAINPVVEEVLNRRKLRFGKGRWVFPTRNGTTYSNRNLLRELKRVGKKAGLPWVDFYTLRHTFATEAAKRFAPYVLKEMMGHSSVRTTDRYYVHLRSTKEWMPPEIRVGSC